MDLNVAGIMWNPMGFVQLWNGFIGIPSEKNMWISAANMCAVSPPRKVVKSPGFFMAGMPTPKKMCSVIFRFSWESLDLRKTSAGEQLLYSPKLMDRPVNFAFNKCSEKRARFIS